MNKEKQDKLKKWLDDMMSQSDAIRSNSTIRDFVVYNQGKYEVVKYILNNYF